MELIGICFLDAPRFRENWFCTAFIHGWFYAFVGAEQGFYWVFVGPAQRRTVSPLGGPARAGFPGKTGSAVARTRAAPVAGHRAGVALQAKSV